MMEQLRIFKRSHVRVKGILILFLAGLLFGALIFYLFQNSFKEALSGLDASIVSLSQEDKSFLYCILFVAIEHTKGYTLLWILSLTKIVLPYILLVTVYKGFCTGFIFCFFFLEYGMRGFNFSLCYYFPQALLLIPVYLLSFQKIIRGNRERTVLTASILYGVLLFACFLEARFHLPMMKQLYLGK